MPSFPPPTPPRPNRDLRDEIRDYWSDRAATFDLDPGHRITEGAEYSAWRNLFQRHLGDAKGRRLLDLASGTAEIALLCYDLGFRVTGLDWSAPMLERARIKADEKKADIKFLQADAERIMVPDASFEVITARHLVWTLVDPVAAFAEWLRVLAPQGQLLIVDGDIVNCNLIGRLLGRMIGSAHPSRNSEMLRRHQEIIAQVHFSNGARAAEIRAMLENAGFIRVTIDTRFGAIHQAQARGLGWKKSLPRRMEHRYAICAVKPE